MTPGDHMGCCCPLSQCVLSYWESCGKAEHCDVGKVLLRWSSAETSVLYVSVVSRHEVSTFDRYWSFKVLRRSS